MNRNFMCYAVMVIIMVLYYYAKQTERYDMKPPVAKKNPYKTTLHGQERIDNYHWIRLTDKQKLAKRNKSCGFCCARYTCYIPFKILVVALLIFPPFCLVMAVYGPICK